MESSTVLSIAAVVCFIVYYEMVTSSYIEHVSVNGIKVRPSHFYSIISQYGEWVDA